LYLRLHPRHFLQREDSKQLYRDREIEREIERDRERESEREREWERERAGKVACGFILATFSRVRTCSFWTITP